MGVIIQILLSLVPPAGLDIRPVNDARASTPGQTGRQETVERMRDSGDTPHPAQGPRWPLRTPAE